MKNLIHKGVYGIITKDDSILLVMKSRGIYKGLFDLPGGRAEVGESQEQTLVREIVEETGIIPKKWQFFDNLKYRCVYSDSGEKINFQHQGKIYTILEYEDNEIDLGRSFEDVDGCEWCDISASELFSPFATSVYKYLIQHGGE